MQILLPMCAIALVVAQVVVSNQLATLSARMGSLDEAVYEARETHAILQTAVASASSLMAIRVRAQESGFREPTVSQVISLIPQVPVAFGGLLQ